MPRATPPGTPWNWTAIRLDHRCPIPPGITPGFEDCLCCCPPWNSLDIGLLSAKIDVAPLAWYNTRPPGFHLPRCCVGRIYSYHPVLCVCFAENSFIPPGIVHMFQRTVFIPPGIVSALKRTSFIPNDILSAFQRTVFPSTSQPCVSGRSQYTRYCVSQK